MFGDIGVAVARQAATSRSDIHSRGLSYRVAQDIQALQHLQGDWSLSITWDLKLLKEAKPQTATPGRYK